MGGDHNVYFRHEGRPIRRSSHALLVDRSDLDTDANTLKELFSDLAEEDCVIYAHVGEGMQTPLTLTTRNWKPPWKSILPGGPSNGC